MHSPLEAPQARIDLLTPRTPDPQRNIFAAMVSELDDGIGRVMGALGSVGMAPNTLTIFSKRTHWHSLHGTHWHRQ